VCPHPLPAARTVQVASASPQSRQQQVPSQQQWAGSHPAMRGPSHPALLQHMHPCLPTPARAHRTVGLPAGAGCGHTPQQQGHLRSPARRRTATAPSSTAQPTAPRAPTTWTHFTQQQAAVTTPQLQRSTLVHWQTCPATTAGAPGHRLPCSQRPTVPVAQAPDCQRTQ
jgi:hypothetical protein